MPGLPWYLSLVLVPEVRCTAVRRRSGAPHPTRSFGACHRVPWDEPGLADAQRAPHAGGSSVVLGDNLPSRDACCASGLQLRGAAQDRQRGERRNKMGASGPLGLCRAAPTVMRLCIWGRTRSRCLRGNTSVEPPPLVGGRRAHADPPSSSFATKPLRQAPQASAHTRACAWHVLVGARSGTGGPNASGTGSSLTSGPTLP